jgi:hypothetical protein
LGLWPIMVDSVMIVSVIVSIATSKRDTPYILIIEKSFDFDDVARQINQFVASGYLITAAIMQSDDGVLVNNRLDKKIPIVDEVSYIDKATGTIFLVASESRSKTVAIPYGFDN